ncbi:polysaccharide deacetylase [Candidatus Epulonipiscioides gigas]|nr:polysaccharide deacetylase [Epulopiscium sp. SCG-C07WGA-EpuloA2]
MNKKVIYGIIVVCLVISNFAIYASDNTKIDWWIVREKDHATPRANDKLSYKYEDYDAYYTGNTNEKVLYLTFDEGYENGYTAKILDVLKVNETPAIFFVTSPYITTNPDLIARMEAEGHMVANHTKNHPSMPNCATTPDVFNKEIKDVEEKYKEVTGKDITKLFRPPMGHYSQLSLELTKQLGYKTLFWSFAYADFDTKKQPEPEKAKKLISDNLHNGAIILLHAVSKTNTEILEDIIKDARAQGYTFKLWPMENKEIALDPQSNQVTTESSDSPLEEKTNEQSTEKADKDLNKWSDVIIIQPAL